MREAGNHTLLSACLLDLARQAHAHQPVMGLELLHGLGRVVHEGEAGRLAAAKLGPQAEDADLVLVRLVHAGQFVAQLLLGDVGAIRVEDVAGGEASAGVFLFSSSARAPSFGRQINSHDHLLPAQERVQDELACPQGNGGVVVRHFDEWRR